MAKLAVLNEKENLIINEFDGPVANDDEAVIRVVSAGVCGTDPHIFDGSRVGVVTPTVMGHEIFGVVEKKGSNFWNKGDNISEGDRVSIVPGTVCGECYYCKNYPHLENLCIKRKIYGVTMPHTKELPFVGGFSDYVVLRPGYWLYTVPEEIGDETASLIEPFAVAIRSFERAIQNSAPHAQMGLAINSEVVVQGVGPIGLLTVAAAERCGMNVTAIDYIDERLHFAKRLGASKTLNVTSLSQQERINKVKSMTNGVGGDAVIECAGTIEAFEEGLHMVRRGGRYVEMGNFADVGTAQIQPAHICRNDIELVGSVISSPWDFSKAISLLKDQSKPFQDMITHRFPVEEAYEAVMNVKQQHGIKTIIVPARWDTG